MFLIYIPLTTCTYLYANLRNEIIYHRIILYIYFELCNNARKYKNSVKVTISFTANVYSIQHKTKRNIENIHQEKFRRLTIAEQ